MDAEGDVTIRSSCDLMSSLSDKEDDTSDLDSDDNDGYGDGI